jgi:hypothetical protein
MESVEGIHIQHADKHSDRIKTDNQKKKPEERIK